MGLKTIREVRDSYFKDNDKPRPGDIVKYFVGKKECLAFVKEVFSYNTNPFERICVCQTLDENCGLGINCEKREEDLTVVERFNSNVDTIDALFGGIHVGDIVKTKHNPTGHLKEDDIIYFYGFALELVVMGGSPYVGCDFINPFSGEKKRTYVKPCSLYVLDENIVDSFAEDWSEKD